MADFSPFPIATRHKRIDAGGTIPLATSSLYLAQLVIIVSDAGTGWKIMIQDLDTPPAVLIPEVTVSAPATAPWVYQVFTNPLPMRNGVNFITTSGTAGVIDIWGSIVQRSNQ